MNDTLAVHERHCIEHGRHDDLDLFFAKCPARVHQIVEFLALQAIHDDVHHFIVLFSEKLAYGDDMRVR